MDNQQILEDPTNRIVAVLDDSAHLEVVKQDLLQCGLAPDEIRVWDGARNSPDVDTSAKWFADTDEELANFQAALRVGKTVISVPVANSEDREPIHAILKRHQSRRITHFGQWVTEFME